MKTFLKQTFQIEVSETLLMDRNAAFSVSKLKKNFFFENFKINHIMSSSHHPENNRKREHLNQTMK